MDNLFNGNLVVLYFLSLIMFLKPEKMKDNQKIFLAYIITFFVDSSEKISTLTIIFIVTVSLFMYFEYFNSSKFKQDIMTRFSHKIVDFSFLMLAQYNYIEFLLIMFLNTKYVELYVSNFNIKDIKMVLNFIQIILAIFIANSIYATKWKMKNLDEIQSEIEFHLKIYNLDINFNKNRFDTVVRLEDKSYYIRNKMSTIISCSYFKYIIKRVINFAKKRKVTKTQIMHLRGNTLKKHCRGHSTIEAQLIRTIGIENGYDWKYINILKRKIFETIYVNLIFNNLEEYYNRMHYKNNNRMKDYILYIYLLSARSRINDREYKGLEELFQKKIIYLTDNELFIGTLTFSKYNLEFESIRENARIYKYQISDANIKNILKKIKSNR